MENFSTRLRKFMEETGVNDNQITIRSGLSNGIIRRVVREANDVAKTKKITFNLKGDFEQSSFYTPTRAYLNDADAAMEDLWLFDYMGDSCLQLLHFTPTDEQWGRPQLSLAYGSHSLYFVASCGITPQLNTTTNTISWERPKDTFWKKIRH